MNRAACWAALALLLVASPTWDATASSDAENAPDWAQVGREAAALLSGAIQIDTTNPPGRELPAARYLMRFFREQGIDAQLYLSAPERGNLVARLPATTPADPDPGPILLLSHLDVVPADPEAWSFPPFSGAIREGFVYGRGSLDDKGQGVVFAIALALLQREGGERHRDLIFCATADEEVDSTFGARWMIEHHWEALGPPAAVWNEGGGSAWVEDLGGALVNGIATSEKRWVWLALTTEGEGGHGSQPHPNAANEVLVAALERIRGFETPLRITPTVAQMFARSSERVSFPRSLVLRYIGNPLALRLAGETLTGSRALNAMVRDTIALTSLRSGLKANLIPRSATATLDIRLLPDTDEEAFLARLEQVIDDPRVRIERIDEKAPRTAPSPWDHELFRALQAEAEREFPESLTVPMLTPGSSDSTFFRERGVPSYGYLPALFSDELSAAFHGVDERLPLSELERAVRVTYRTLRRLTQLREGGR